MLEYVPEIIEAGVECLRIEEEMYDRNKTGEITREYGEAMDKGGGRGCEGEYTTGHYFIGGGMKIKFCNTFERKRQVNITCPK